MKKVLFMILFVVSAILIINAPLMAQVAGVELPFDWPVDLTIPEQIYLIVGVVLPLVSQWVVKNLKSSRQKYFVLFGLIVITGIGIAFLAHFKFSDWFNFIRAVGFYSAFAYYAFWKKVFEEKEVGSTLLLKPDNK